MDKFIEFAPLIVVVVLYLTQQHTFVRPEELEKKHREILKDVDEKYTSLTAHNELKNSVAEMKDKIDKIFDLLIAKEEEK